MQIDSSCELGRVTALKGLTVLQTAYTLSDLP
jgi:hypothetical protein